MHYQIVLEHPLKYRNMDKIKKILILSTVIIVILLIIFLAISIVRLKSLQLDYDNAMNNITAYQLENSKLSNANRVYKMTISEL